MERYDTENQVWELVAPVRIARSALSLTSLDGKLYAIGGFDGTNFLSIVEVYDPKANTWEQGTPLNSGRSGHASAVIYQPSCAANFMDCIDIGTSKRDGSDSCHDETSRSSNNSQTDHQFDSSKIRGSCFHFNTSFSGSSCRNCECDLKPKDYIEHENSNEYNTRLLTLFDKFFYMCLLKKYLSSISSLGFSEIFSQENCYCSEYYRFLVLLRYFKKCLVDISFTGIFMNCRKGIVKNIF